MWLNNLGDSPAASEAGAPVGPGAGLGLMLLYVGRVIILSFSIDMLLSIIKRTTM